MNKTIIATITIGTIVICVFVFFLFALAYTNEPEDIPLLPHHYTPSHILRPEPSVTIHNSVSD